MIDSTLWRVGDIVTRDGTDEHEILEIDRDLILVLCVKEPKEAWTKIGETESNLTRRYDFVRAGRKPCDTFFKYHATGRPAAEVDWVFYFGPGEDDYFARCNSTDS